MRRTHTHFEYRMVWIWFLTEGARKIESWGLGITRQGRRQSGGESAESQRFQGGRQKVVLESWCYTRKGIQWYSRRIVAQFQGISNGVSLDTNSPDGSRGGPGGLESHQALREEWSWRPGVIPGRLGQKWSTWRRLYSRELPSV